MRGMTRQRRFPFAAFAIALAVTAGAAGFDSPASAQTPPGLAVNERGEIVAVWEVDPPEIAACSGLLIPWIFGDDLESGSTCAWSARAGSDEDCTVCGDGVVSAADGEECDDGNLDPTDGCTDSCQYARCGDGILWSGFEACDQLGVPSATCDSDCTEPECGDLLVNLGNGEQCDDGNADENDACASCQVAFCGDGHLWSGREVCDPAIDPDTCYGDCTQSACGDGTVVAAAGEVCDDGNVVTESQCPYGTVFCTTCNASCSAQVQLLGPYCGDGILTSPETCDDSNTVNESRCAYGVPSCEVCSSSCTLVPRTGDLCGDGVANFPFEDCDDGNSLACGTCSANCRSPQPPLAATGMLVVPAGIALLDGETFVLQDSLGAFSVFEFDRTGNGVSPGAVAVNVTGTPSASQVRDACIGAVSGAPGLSIDASVGGPQIVALVQQIPSSAGNVAIQELVSNTGFVALGMSGGQAGNCAGGAGCISGSDCQSGLCTSGVCGGP